MRKSYMIALLVAIVAIAAYFSKSYWMPIVAPSEEVMVDTGVVQTGMDEILTGQSQDDLSSLTPASQDSDENLIAEYYSLLGNGVRDSQYFEKASMLTVEGKSVQQYQNTYRNVIYFLLPQASNIVNKGNNTYYFPVTLGSERDAGKCDYCIITEEIYGVTKQVIEGKLKSVSSVLLSDNEGYITHGGWEAGSKRLMRYDSKTEDPDKYVKDISIIEKYYQLLGQKDFASASSLVLEENSLDRYKQNYGNYDSISTEIGSGWKEKSLYSYKGNDTYYFSVLLSNKIEEREDNTLRDINLYGVAMQIVGGKLKQVNSVLLNKYQVEACNECGDKPVIYLYPEKTTNVDVNLDLNGYFTFTYPKIPSNNTRSVIADPNGMLVSRDDGKKYSYLFREAAGMDAFTLNEGFTVSKEDYVSFLQEKLEYLGLTSKEYNEFIVYRVPLMNKYPYVQIRFVEQDYTDQAKLTITPKPDSMQRVFMIFKGIYSPTYLPQQKLTPFQRSGFSVIEWGGTEIY